MGARPPSHSRAPGAPLVRANTGAGNAGRRRADRALLDFLPDPEGAAPAVLPLKRRHGYIPRVSVASATRPTATIYAAVRMSTLCFFEVSRTSLKDFTITSLRRALIVASRQNRFWRSCTHSK